MITCKFHSHVSTRFTLMFPPVSQTCFHSFHFYVSTFRRFCEMILERWLANVNRLNLIFSLYYIRWSGYGETQHVKNQRGVSRLSHFAKKNTKAKKIKSLKIGQRYTRGVIFPLFFLKSIIIDRFKSQHRIQRMRELHIQSSVYEIQTPYI